jgi:ABC-type sugar transport system ATPase subunit
MSCPAGPVVAPNRRNLQRSFGRCRTAGARPPKTWAARSFWRTSSALLRNPRLLIPDEGTNAIEATLERQVLDAIRRRLPDAALLVITHRPNAVFDADRVVRLVEGRVVSPVVAAGSQ